MVYIAFAKLKKITIIIFSFSPISFAFPQTVSLLALSKSTHYKVHFTPRTINIWTIFLLYIILCEKQNSF